MSDSETKQLKTMEALSSEYILDARLSREASQAERIARLGAIEVKSPFSLEIEKQQKASTLQSDARIDFNEMSKENWELYKVFFRELEGDEYRDLFSHAAFLRFGKRMNPQEMSEDKVIEVLKDYWEAQSIVFARRNASDEYLEHIPLKRRMLMALKEINSELNGD